ncbi:MAG: SDR family oxidoreductase [Rhodocyclaceae bacterium]|nr:SDR family oxidoreductase [Rhodocyclaceae bacterium]
MKAIVTGSSRGLGAAIVARLLARKIEVLGLARQQPPTLPPATAARYTHATLDLADTGALEDWLAGSAMARFVAGAERALLINNAGTLQPVGPLGGQDAAAIARAIRLNVSAPLALADAFVAATAQVRDRRIVHISSGAARSAYAGWSVYGASKAALDHHARGVHEDAVPGLRICALAPGVVDTDMQAEVRGSDAAHFPMRARFEALKRDGMLTSPAACAAQLVDYLLSADFARTPVADLRALSGH